MVQSLGNVRVKTFFMKYIILFISIFLFANYNAARAQNSEKNQQLKIENLCFECGDNVFLKDSCTFYFECDCCSAILIFYDEETFYSFVQCVEKTAVTRGTYSINNDEIEFRYCGVTAYKEEIDTVGIIYSGSNIIYSEKVSSPFIRTEKIDKCGDKIVLIDKEQKQRCIQLEKQVSGYEIFDDYYKERLDFLEVKYFDILNNVFYVYDGDVLENVWIYENEGDTIQLLIFEPCTLDSMLCIDHSESTFDEDNNYDILDYSRGDEEYLQGKIKLTEENVRKMLLGNKNIFERTNYWHEEVVDTITVEEYLKDKDFYLTNVVSSNEKWTAIIIETIDSGTSDKYLVTIDQHQNLISKFRIAFWGRFGTYTGESYVIEDEDGNILYSYERHPWYTSVTGCIDKDLTIGKNYSMGGFTAGLFIDDNGNIVKKK